MIILLLNGCENKPQQLIGNFAKLVLKGLHDKYLHKKLSHVHHQKG